MLPRSTQDPTMLPRCTWAPMLPGESAGTAQATAGSPKWHLIQPWLWLVRTRQLKWLAHLLPSLGVSPLHTEAHHTRG